MDIDSQDYNESEHFKANCSSFQNLYKFKNEEMHMGQNKRRKELLSLQRKKREELLNDLRGVNNEECNVEERVIAITSLDTTKKIRYKKYDKVMLSEWFIEVPEDFDVDWVMKICPKGHRSIVIAKNGSTKSFSKFGNFECKFKSILPGGTESTAYKTTVLDCIWNEKQSIYYILDFLVWSSYDYTDFEAEVRFFFLQSKLQEFSDLETISNENRYIFKLLEYHSCDFITLKTLLEKYPYYFNDEPPIDGLLFFHKESSYTSGLKSPLVTWLKPYMIPEILNVPVAEEYILQKPEKYKSLVKHIKYSMQKKKKKSRRYRQARKRHQNVMEHERMLEQSEDNLKEEIVSVESPDLELMNTT